MMFTERDKAVCDDLDMHHRPRVTTHEEILDALYDTYPVGTAKTIAHNLVLSTSTVRRYLDRMVKAGIVGHEGRRYWSISAEKEMSTQS